MRQLSQYYARRLLELVCDNKTTPADRDHIDHDVWARTHPPVQGLNFRDRETATCCLRAGGLGAVPSNPQQLQDVQSPSLPPATPNQKEIPRVESVQSKFTVSSVPSSSKMRQPLMSDSAQLNTPPARPAPVTEYQEWGGEALIARVQDELEEFDDEFEDSSPSRLFTDIGPSISVANDIHGKKLKQASQLPSDNFDKLHNNPFPMKSLYDHDETGSDTECEHLSVSSPPKSIPSQPKTISSLPSTTSSLPPPPLPSYALERNHMSENEPLNTQFQRNAILVPPPPPPLHTVQSYGSTPAVPPPPSSPPPQTDEKRLRRDTDDSSPITEGDSYDYKADLRDEFSDLADSSVPSIRTDWNRAYAPSPTSVHKDDDDIDIGLGARRVESDEEHEYEHQVHVMVDRNPLGRSNPLLVPVEGTRTKIR